MTSTIKWGCRSPMLRSALIVAGLFGLGGCAAMPSSHSSEPVPAAIQTVQLGDNNLTCEELSSQIADMDRLAAAPSAGGTGAAQQAATGVATQAATRVALSTGAAAIPFVGGLISAGMSAANRPNVENLQAAANQRMQAMQRKQYLTQIFASKKC